MPRIIAGEAKGRRIRAPRGQQTRPTAARVKQTLFDILGPRLPGAHFLDLCAGAGTIGLEAASRGAGQVVLVESDRRAAAMIRTNAAQLAPAAKIGIHVSDCLAALKALARQGARFDLVYLDPPYDSDLYEPVLAAIERLQLTAEGGLVVAEHFHKRPLPERIGALQSERSVRIGDHRLTFFGRTEPPHGEREET